MASTLSIGIGDQARRNLKEKNEKKQHNCEYNWRLDKFKMRAVILFAILIVVCVAITPDPDAKRYAFISYSEHKGDII